MRERRVRGNLHARCGVGEKKEYPRFEIDYSQKLLSVISLK